MKKIFLFLCTTLFFFGCKPPIKIVSSVKQTIIPGRPNLKKFSNYVIKFSLDKEVAVAVDSVSIIEDNMVYTTNFSLKKMGSPTAIKNLKEKGNYILEVRLKDQNIIKSSSDQSGENKLTVYYTKDQKREQLEITEFETKTVTKRAKKPR